MSPNPTNDEAEGSVASERTSTKFEIIALSGGGLRATLFHLGVFVHLALAKKLNDVRLIVSVSGGSILSAHFAKNWCMANGGRDEFVRVSADLVKFIRSDIRNSVLIPWLWSRLLVFSWPFARFGRTSRLARVYASHFGQTSLGDLPRNPNSPHIAIAATDSIKRERIAFTADKILRFNFEGPPHPNPIPSQGVRLSLAVTASSCFPPVFPRMHVNYEDLALKFDEFKEVLNLNDGGVAGNLGFELLHAMKRSDSTLAGPVIFSDAERPQASQPGNSPITDLDAQRAALSASARQRIKQEFGDDSTLLRFADRVPDARGLPYVVETDLAGYRTDLDRPTWEEIQTLMTHGAAICANALGELTTNPGEDDVNTVIQKILVGAGGPQQLTTRARLSLKNCGRRPYGKLLLHGFLVTCCLAGLLGLSLWVAIAAFSSGPAKRDLIPSNDHALNLEELKLHVRKPPTEEKRAEVRPEYFPIVGQEASVALRQIDEPFGKIDDIVVEGRFNQPAYWSLVWFDPTGKIEVIEESAAPSARVRYPRDPNEPIVVLVQPKGVHMILLLAQKGGKLQDKASLAKLYHEVGLPPNALPKRAAIEVRSPTTKKGTPIRLPSDFLERIEKSTPQSIDYAYAFFLEAK